MITTKTDKTEMTGAEPDAAKPAATDTTPVDPTATTPATTTAAADDQPSAEPSGAATDVAAEARAEAKSYRLKLRTAETLRDDLASKLAALQMAEVNRILAEGASPGLPISGAVKPDAFWRSDVTLDDVLNDDGTVNSEKVRKAAKTAAELFGIPYRLPGPYSPNEGHINEPGHGTGWSRAFEPAD